MRPDSRRTSQLQDACAHKFIKELVARPGGSSLGQFSAALTAASRAAGPDPSCIHDEGGQPFPSRLPFGPPGATPASPRRRRRWLRHTGAEAWANAMWAMFSYWEAGSPHGAEKITNAVHSALRARGGAAARRFA